MSDDYITEGCGYEYDHKIRKGENICQECGAEILDEVDDYCDECEQPLASDGACYGNHGDGMDEVDE